MSTTKETRPIDANNLARRIREYMDDFPNATTRLATCRAILSMLGDETQTPTLRPITREQVEKVWKGEWIIPTIIGGRAYNIPHCSACNGVPCGTDEHTRFCAHCGAPMTDEAVQMVMERMEKLKNEIG